MTVGKSLSSFALVPLYVASLLSAPQPGREDWGAPDVSVTHDGTVWRIDGKKNAVTLDEADLAIRVVAANTRWDMVGSEGDDVIVKFGGETIPLRLTDARKVRISPYDTGYKTGLKISLEEFQHHGAPLDLSLSLTVCLEGEDQDLVFDVAADLACQFAGSGIVNRVW